MRDSPLYGIMLDGFQLHSADVAAPLLDGAWILVAANSGLWLHEGETLVRRARLAPPPIKAMAASPKGDRYAWVDGAGGLTMAAFPSLKTIARVAEVDTPAKMRFSPEGDRVVIGSHSDYVTVYNDKGDTVFRYDENTDVNDAILLPGGKEVAFVSDSDDAYVYDIATGRELFDSAGLYKDHAGRHAPYPTRDQNAIAYHAPSGELLSGGEDDRIWRYLRFRDDNPKSASVELSGNIDDLVCCRDEDVVAGDDSGNIFVVGLDGKTRHRLGPLRLLQYAAIRVDVMPQKEQGVIAVLDGMLLRWLVEPNLTVVSRDYTTPVELQVDQGNDDSAIAMCAHDDEKQRCVVHYVEHGARGDLLETTIAGEIETPDGVTLMTTPSGHVALYGNEAGKLVMARVAATLGSPVTTSLSASGRVGTRRDTGQAVFLDQSGTLYELNAEPTGASEIGKRRGKGDVLRLEFDDDQKRWLIVSPSLEREPL